MKFSRVVPLLPLASALVITDAEVFQNIEKSGRSIIGNTQNVLDGALGKAEEAFGEVNEDAKGIYSKIHHAGCDIESWLDSSNIDNTVVDFEKDHEHPHHAPSQDGPPHGGPPHGGPPHDGPLHGGPPHEGPPHDKPAHGGPPHDKPLHDGPPRDKPLHDGPPHGKPPHDAPPHDGPSQDKPSHDKPPHGKPPHDKPPHGGPPHDGPPHDGPPPHGPPHHGKPHHPHDQKPNQTIYELISKSKYTTKLAKLIDEYDDLVSLLNSTKANYTVFAPTDKAFEKIPEHHKKPSKEILKDVLLYHVSDDFYPAGRVLHSYTIPTLYEPESLGHKQRLTVRVTLRGPTINFHSRLVAADIFATNGVIHGVDSILIPPPKVATIVSLLPGEFSTLALGLSKTSIDLNSTEYPHEGGTLFAPNNFAFKKLGPKINAFLFSKYGEKYLRALLEYHLVVNQTLYSDAFYDATSEADEAITARPPYYHYDLPTVLDGKYLAVDVSRYGPFVSIRINGFSRVTVHDGVASDGVLQVVSDVLLPPKNTAGGEQVFWTGEEMSVEEFKERLQPFVDENPEL